MVKRQKMLKLVYEPGFRVRDLDEDAPRSLKEWKEFLHQNMLDLKKESSKDNNAKTED